MKNNKVKMDYYEDPDASAAKPSEPKIAFRQLTPEQAMKLRNPFTEVTPEGVERMIASLSMDYDAGDNAFGLFRVHRRVCLYAR